MQFLVTIAKEVRPINFWSMTVVLIVILALSFYKIYLETKEEEEEENQKKKDRWNNPDNWRHH